MEIKSGDTFTIAGVYEMIPNPNRKWFHFWKPRKIVSDRLVQFRATP